MSVLLSSSRSHGSTCRWYSNLKLVIRNLRNEVPSLLAPATQTGVEWSQWTVQHRGDWDVGRLKDNSDVKVKTMVMPLLMHGP